MLSGWRGLCRANWENVYFPAASMRFLTHSRLSRRKTGGAEPRGTRHLSASASNQEGGIFLPTLADRGHKKA